MIAEALKMGEAGPLRSVLLLLSVWQVAAFAPSAPLIRGGVPAARGTAWRISPVSPRCSVDVADTQQVKLRELPSTYRALWGSQVGESFKDVAVVKEMPMREPQAGEVLVQVVYAGVNGGCETFRARGEHWFADNKLAAAGFALGAEGVGLVARVGPEVEGLAVGDAVSFVGGAFAEYVVAQAARCSKIKEASAAAVAARISGTTAMGAVVKMGQATERQVVLVTAGGGAAGSFAVQIAKQMGCDVVATCGSAEKAKLLCDLGCDTIINYRTRDVGEALSKTYPNGVDLVVEHVGGALFQTALEHLKPKGRLILVGYISEYPHNGAVESAHQFDLADIFWKQKVVEVPDTQQTIYGKLYPSMDAAVEARREVEEMLEQGRIRAVIDPRPFVGVTQVVDAVEHMLSGKALGKVVVRIS